MNDKELSYMLAIAKEGSIQKAAASLGKNPSSLRDFGILPITLKPV